MIKPFVTQFGEFPWYLEVYLVAQAVKHLPAMWETGFDPWVGKIPWRRKWQSTPVLLPGKSHGQRSLVGYSPWGHKKLDTTERLHFHFNWRIITLNIVLVSVIHQHESAIGIHMSPPPLKVSSISHPIPPPHVVFEQWI